MKASNVQNYRKQPSKRSSATVSDIIQIDSDSLEQKEPSVASKSNPNSAHSLQSQGFFNRHPPLRMQTSSVQQITQYQAQNRLFPHLNPSQSESVHSSSTNTRKIEPYFNQQYQSVTFLTPQIVQKQIAASYLKQGQNYNFLEEHIKLDIDQHRYTQILHTILIKSLHKLEQILLKSFKVKVEPLSKVNLRNINLMNCKAWLSTEQYLTFLKIISINYSIQRQSLQKDKSLSLYKCISKKCQEYETITTERLRKQHKMRYLKGIKTKKKQPLNYTESIPDIQRELGELIVTMKYEDGIIKNTETRQRKGALGWERIAIILAERNVLREAISKVEKVSRQMAAKKGRTATPLTQEQVQYLVSSQLPKDLFEDLLRVYLEEFDSSVQKMQLMTRIKKHLVEMKLQNQ